MGRHTYDGFAPVWPTRSGDPFSDHINAMTKYVVSSTLTDPEWNNTTVISGDPVAVDRATLKQQPGQDIVQYGFGQLSHALLAAGLLDRLVLWVHPFVIGKGGPDALLYRDNKLATFQLVDAMPLESHHVVLTYARAAS